MVVICSGCSIGRLSSIDDVSDHEIIAVGRAKVIYNGRDVTKGSNLVFNAPVYGFPKYQCILDDSGYIFTKLPREYVSLTNLVHPEGLITKTVAKDQLVVNLKHCARVCYIGDITFDWNGINDTEARRRNAAAALNMYSVNLPINDNLIIRVERRNLKAVEQEFQLRYKNSFKVEQFVLESKTQ